ncbi:MAG: acetylxylan esterase [Bianqueaceae bacterium]
MPIVDKPIQELLQYQGNTPRPADFDEFWDARLTQLDGIDPKPELVESSFQTSYAECFDLYFTSTKGANSC